MKHTMKAEPKEIECESTILKANDYTYRTNIPKEVMRVFPQLKENAKIVYKIKQISINQFECDMYFQAENLELDDTTDDKETASAIEKPKEKTTEKQSTSNDASNDAGNVLDVNHFENVAIQDGKYTIKVTSPKRPLLRVTGATIKDEINKKEITITVANKSEDEVRAIIDAIQSIENADAKSIFEVVESFKSERYRTS